MPEDEYLSGPDGVKQDSGARAQAAGWRMLRWGVLGSLPSPETGSWRRSLGIGRTALLAGWIKCLEAASGDRLKGGSGGWGEI